MCLQWLGLHLSLVDVGCVPHVRRISPVEPNRDTTTELLALVRRRHTQLPAPVGNIPLAVLKNIYKYPTSIYEYLQIPHEYLQISANIPRVFRNICKYPASIYEDF